MEICSNHGDTDSNATTSSRYLRVGFGKKRDAAEQFSDFSSLKCIQTLFAMHELEAYGPTGEPIYQICHIVLTTIQSSAILKRFVRQHAETWPSDKYKFGVSWGPARTLPVRGTAA